MTKDYVMETIERWLHIKYNYFNLEVVSLNNKKKEINIRFEDRKEVQKENVE